MIIYNIMDFVLDNENHYTLWHNGDVDSFLLQDGTLVFGNTQEALREKVSDIQMEDFVIYQYCDELNVDAIECCAFLEYWNSISDLAAALFVPFSGDQEEGITQVVYRKLFYGCHFDEYTDGEPMDFGPWTLEEKDCLRKVMEEGKEMLRKHMKK